MKTFHQPTRQRRTGPSTYELVWESASFAIQQAKLCLANSVDVEHGFEKIRQAIERLPLAQDEFALATRSLDNAQQYSLRQEKGAAKFELNLLGKMISREVKCAKITRKMNSRG